MKKQLLSLALLSAAWLAGGSALAHDGDHSYTNGICSIAGCTDKYQAPELVDGWYQLGNVGNVEWFSAQIAAGNNTYKAKLTQDIDFDGLGDNFHTPIGNYSQKFIGQFDGDNHSIKNMVLLNPSRSADNGFGFFGCVRLGGGNGANLVEIKNLTIDSSCSVSANNNYVGGLIGRISENTANCTVHIENCINKADVTSSTNGNTGGLIGQINASGGTDRKIEIVNCQNTGTITSHTNNAGGLVGQINGAVTLNISNSTNTGSVSADNYAAGILAQMNADNATANITHCTNSGNITTTLLAASGIASQINNKAAFLTIESCMNLGNISCNGNQTNSKNAGSIFGVNTSSNSNSKIVIINCGNRGSVSGKTETAALVGWIGGNGGKGHRIENCWNTGEVTGISPAENPVYRGTATVSNIYNTQSNQQGTQITNEMIASGELCYQLNGDQSVIAWTQTLDGTQEYPLPVADGDQVYFANDTFCDGSVRPYSNHEGGHVFGHNINDEIGMCDVCHTQFQEPDLVDGWYQLKNAGNVEWFSDKVNGGEITIKGKMMNDIDFTGVNHTPIGNRAENKYNGTFDGQGHRITNMNINRDSENNIGFFGWLRVGGTTTIKNLIIDASCSIHGNNRIGGITGTYQTPSGSNGTITIENVINEANISAKGQDAGGIFGGREGGNATIIIKNVLNKGNVTSTHADAYVGALCSYLESNGDSKIENFVNLGTIGTHNGGNIGRHNISNSNVTNLIDLSDTANKTQGTGSELVAADVASGKLAWYLNNNDNQDGDAFYQTIGTDDYPMPFNSSQQVREANTGNYTNLTVSESAVQIGSAANLNKFAAEVNAGNTSMDAVLTSDVDMSSVTYTPIGNNTNKYHGTFDGSGHKVNLNIDANAYGQGFISIATGGATVKNLVVTGSVKNAGSKTAGIIAEAIGGGVVTIQNCGNEATIQGTSGETAAIVANNWGYQCTLNIENVYNIGDVSGSGDVSTRCACQGNTASVFKNVYNSGSVTGATQGNFVRPSNSGYGTYTNCYSTTLSNDNASIISTNTSAVESGELCAKLGFGFRQNLSSDAYPNFASGHGFVAQIGAARYTTMYNIYSDVTIPSGIEAFAGRVNDKTVTLLPLTGSIAASEPVILRGDAGLYNFMPTTGAMPAATNNLQGSNGSVTGNGSTIYALAKFDDKVGFYQVDNGVVIPAGKAYLIDTTGSSVKGFTFVFDDIEDGINSLTPALSEGEGAIYNVAGQKLSKMQKGINIVNGKKILK